MESEDILAEFNYVISKANSALSKHQRTGRKDFLVKFVTDIANMKIETGIIDDPIDLLKRIEHDAYVLVKKHNIKPFQAFKYFNNGVFNAKKDNTRLKEGEIYEKEI